MSSSEGTEARRPLRSAGIGLLGLGVVATAIGLVVGLTGDQDDRADGSGGPAPAGDIAPPATPPPPTSLPSATTPPTATPPPALPETSPPAPAPTTTAAPPRTTPPPAAAPAPAAPSQTSTAPVPGAPGPAPSGSSGSSGTRADQPNARGQLRVYNNSTIRGLAARAADDFTAAGWTVVEVGNYPSGRIPTSTVYYQEGNQQRSEAEALAAEFGLRVQPRFVGIADASPGVIVIVTNDYRS